MRPRAPAPNPRSLDFFVKRADFETFRPMLTIATWNINSVRLRIDTVCRFLAEAQPHVLCLQEIKCRNGEFPEKAFKQAGYRHMHVVGQKGWHGVAIVSRVKFEAIEAPAICP